jgi:hypothetical protein
VLYYEREKPQLLLNFKILIENYCLIYFYLYKGSILSQNKRRFYQNSAFLIINKVIYKNIQTLIASFYYKTGRKKIYFLLYIILFFNGLDIFLI